MNRITLALVLAFGLGACWEVGGANTQESVRGNTDTGNVVGQQLIVSRDGHHLIAAGRLEGRADGARDVFAVDLTTFASVPLDLSVDAQRMAFASGDNAYFVSQVGAGESIVERVSLATGRRLGRWPVPVDMTYMTYDERSDRLAFWSIFRTDLFVLDPNSGSLETRSFDRSLVDLRWLPSGELGVVLLTTWDGDDPSAEVILYSPTWRERRFEVPNCASRLVVSPATDIALMAPMSCQKDPVSVIDLGRAAFVENLPGFGPVAFSPDGQTVVAFGRQADLAGFGIETLTPYSLLFISLDGRTGRDTEVPRSRSTHRIETLDIGDALPIYQLTPDGQVVLIYSVFASASYDGIYLVDVATRSIRETSGPELPLDEFVITPDSRLVYLIEGGLFRLDVATGKIAFVPLECGGPGEPSRCNPELVNLLPDGRTLVLGWRDDPEYALFDIAREAVTRTFVVGARATVAGD